MEAVLLLAGLIADHFANPDSTDLDQLEAAREGCRNLCFHVGLGPHTACFGIFDHLKKLNYYQKFYLHKELKMLNTLLPIFEGVAPELTREVNEVLIEVFAALAMDQ
eukprot:s19_g47.t1